MSHEEIIKEKDDQINENESNIKKIKENAQLINKTIDEQKVIIQKMYDGMYRTQKKMGIRIKKICAFFQNLNQNHIKIFLFLLCVAIIMFFILFLFYKILLFFE